MGCGGDRKVSGGQWPPLQGAQGAVAPEHNAPWEASPQERQLETILHNIERYDGTAAGQKEVII